MIDAHPKLLWEFEPPIIINQPSFIDCHPHMSGLHPTNPTNDVLQPYGQQSRVHGPFCLADSSTPQDLEKIRVDGCEITS